MQERRELASFGLVDELERVNGITSLDFLRAPISSDLIEKMAQTAIELAHEEGTSLSALYIDLDNLKEVNEEAGHIAGNNLLRVVDNVLRSSIIRSDTDLVISEIDSERVGGDEWIVLSPVDESGAQIIKDRLVTKVEEGISLIDDITIKRCSPGVSIGHATILPGDDVSGRELLDLADKDLQRVKRSKDPQLSWSKTVAADIAEFLLVRIAELTPSQFVKYTRSKRLRQTQHP